MANYDTALIMQIVKSGGDNVVGRVVNALVPGAPITEETKRAARAVLAKMFNEDKIKCPRCDAIPADAESRCFGDANCPVTV